MPFQIALLQYSPKRKDVVANISQVGHLLQGIKADLVVLPELANSGYLYESPEDLLPYCEPADGSGLFLSEMIKIARDVEGLIIVGYAELDHGRIFNSAAAVSSDGVIQNYRKIHLYSDEKDLFQPGDLGFKTVTWRSVIIGMMICFDWIFPESARTLALSGAQVIAHPANLVMPYCQNAMVTRSIENKVFTITANRIGEERLKDNKLRFTGQSQMTGPAGQVLFRAPENKATVHVMPINPEEASSKLLSNRNDLFDDRKPAYYQC